MDVTVAPWKQNLNSKGPLHSHTLSICDLKKADCPLDPEEASLNHIVIDIPFLIFRASSGQAYSEQTKANNYECNEQLAIRKHICRLSGEKVTKLD